MSSTTTTKATKKVTKKRVTSTPSNEPVVETTATTEIQIEAPEIKKRKVTKKVVKTASKETKEIEPLKSTETVITVEDAEQPIKNVQNEDIQAVVEEEKICQSFTEQVTLNNPNDQSTSTTTTAVVDVLELGVSEREYKIPDNVIAPSKHKNNPNNFYLFNDLEVKTRNKQPLSTLEFQQLLKGLRSLNQAGFNMVYLLIRTFSIHQKNQINLFDIPFKGKINNQSSSTYDIEYDLTELPAQLQHILLLFTNKHLQVMKEDKQQTHQTQQMVVSTASF
jgi:hypothetical protein